MIFDASLKTSFCSIYYIYYIYYTYKHTQAQKFITLEKIFLQKWKLLHSTKTKTLNSRKFCHWRKSYYCNKGVMFGVVVFGTRERENVTERGRKRKTPKTFNM